MRLLIVALLFMLAGCAESLPMESTDDGHAAPSEAGDETGSATSGGPETSSTGEPDRKESDVTIMPTTSIPFAFRAEKTITYTNDVIADIAQVFVDVSSSDVTITSTEDDGYTLTIVVYGRGATEQEAQQNMEGMSESHAEGDGLLLTTDIERVSGENNGATVMLELPSLYLTTLDVDSSSGDVTLDGLDGAVAVVDSSSGNQQMDIDFDSLLLGASSGDITASGTVGDVVIDTSSGEQDLAFTAARTGSWILSASSGEIMLNARGGAYDVIADTSSGNIELGFEGDAVGEQDEDHAHIRSDGFEDSKKQVSINIETSSGDITASD